MKHIVRAGERGGGDFGWLSTRHSFSFGQWYEPSRMGFGALRVLNDDIVAPESGFATHAHENMEIITIVTEGVVTHTDNIGNTYELGVGEVQVMSAGTGVRHSEYNNSEDAPLKLFQLWILPKVENTKPAYAQKKFAQILNEAQLLVSPDGRNESLSIGQDAYISRLTLQRMREYLYELHSPENGVFVFVITGSAKIQNEVLGERDSVELTDTPEVFITAEEETELLIIEVPVA